MNDDAIQAGEVRACYNIDWLRTTNCSPPFP